MARKRFTPVGSHSGQAYPKAEPGFPKFKALTASDLRQAVVHTRPYQALKLRPPAPVTIVA